MRFWRFAGVWHKDETRIMNCLKKIFEPKLLFEKRISNISMTLAVSVGAYNLSGKDQIFEQELYKTQNQLWRYYHEKEGDHHLSLGSVNFARPGKRGVGKRFQGR